MKSEPIADHERPDWRKRPRKVTTRRLLKPRNDSRLDHLSYEQREKLNDWLLNQPLRLKDIHAKLLVEFGVKTTVPAISKYFQRYCYAELLRRREAAQQSERIEKNAEALIDVLTEKALREARKSETTQADLQIAVDLILRLKNQAVEEQKVELMRWRLSILEGAQNVKETKLNDDEIERMRAILRPENGQGLLE